MFNLSGSPALASNFTVSTKILAQVETKFYVNCKSEDISDRIEAYAVDAFVYHAERYNLARIYLRDERKSGGGRILSLKKELNKHKKEAFRYYSNFWSWTGELPDYAWSLLLKFEKQVNEPAPVAVKSNDGYKKIHVKQTRYTNTRAAPQRPKCRITEQSGVPKPKPIGYAKRYKDTVVFENTRKERRELHKRMRAARDEQQRIAQEERVKAAYKALPKAQREAMIKENRDKRASVFEAEEQSGVVREDVVEQSGVTALVVGLSAAVVGITTARVGKRAKDLMDELKDKIFSFFRDLKRRLGKVLATALLVGSVWFLCHKFQLFPLNQMVIITSILAAFVGKDLWSHVSDFFREDTSDTPAGEIQEQSGTLPNVAALISSVLCFQAFKGRNLSMNVTEFTKRISNYDRMTTGIDSFVRWSLQTFEHFIAWVAEKFGKDYKKKIRTEDSVLKEWYRKVDKAVDMHNTNGVNVDNNEINHLVDLAREGSALIEVYRGTQCEKHIRAGRANVHSLIHPHLGSLNARKNNRVEPTMIVFAGKPGVGKTVLIEALCSAILIKAGLVEPSATEDEVLAHVYQKGTSEYWNGYSGQYATIFDDIWQQRPDPSDKDNEFINVIRMIGSWAFPLNFADLDSKGKIYFSSKLVLGTTNLDSIDSEASKVIQDPEAVVRRIKFPYTMRPVPSMSTDEGKLDYAKFHAEMEKCASHEDPIQRFPWYIWEVARHNFHSGKTSEQWRPMSEALDEMINEVRARELNYKLYAEQKRNFISGMLKGVREQSGVPEHDEDLLFLRLPTVGHYAMAMLPSVLLQSGGFISQRAATYINALIAGGVFAHGTMPQLQKWCGFRTEARLARLKLYEDRNAMWKDADVFLTQLKTLGIYAGCALGTLALTALLVVAVKSVSALFKFLFGRSDGVIEQSNRNAKIRPQSDDRPCASLVYQNGYRVYVNQEDGTILVLGQVTFVTSDMAIQPSHFTTNVERAVGEGRIYTETPLNFCSCVNTEHSWTISAGEFLSLQREVIEDMDLEAVRYKNIRAHKNIVNKFILEKDVHSLSGEPCVLEIARPQGTHRGLPQRTPFHMNSVALGGVLHYASRMLSRHYTYRAPTKQGDCGAPLVRLDESRSNGGVCMGFHVAGCTSSNEGYSNVVTRELLTILIERMRVIKDDFQDDLKERGVIIEQSGELPFKQAGSFLPICTVQKPVSIAPRSKIYRVPYTFGELGPYDCKPAPLSPVFRDGEVIYPMENAVKPYSTPVLIYSQPWLEQAVYQAMRKLITVTQDYSRRIFSFEEAILGIPNEKFRAIPRSTAAGFPYCYDVKNGKKDFFGDEADYKLDTPMAIELRERVDHVIAKAKQNVRLAHVFVDFLKDEIRSDAKVKAVATRLISSAPLDYTVAWRMYFGAFSTAVMRTYVNSGMAPGICTYTDWEKLRTHLNIKGDKVFDGDFKAFDSSEQPCVHSAILESINDWYDDGEENKRVRRVLWEDLVHSRHIGGKGADQRHIYQWNKSLPSGHPFTTIINSIYSLTMLVGAYISITGRTDFWRHVSPITYGDDNACNVTDEIAPVFNQETVAKALHTEFSMTYTPGRKDGVWTPTCGIEDITFLKRGFLKDPMGWLCPLEFDSFYYTCYYNKNPKEEKKIVGDVLENTLLELSLHKPAVWDEKAPAVLRLMKRLGYVPLNKPTRESYLTEIRKRGDNWY